MASVPLVELKTVATNIIKAKYRMLRAVRGHAWRRKDSQGRGIGTQLVITGGGGRRGRGDSLATQPEIENKLSQTS